MAMQAAHAVHECIKLRLVKADDFNLLVLSRLSISEVLVIRISSINASYKKNK
jgi:hypothetical protein